MKLIAMSLLWLPATEMNDWSGAHAGHTWTLMAFFAGIYLIGSHERPIRWQVEFSRVQADDWQEAVIACQDNTAGLDQVIYHHVPWQIFTTLLVTIGTREE